MKKFCPTHCFNYKGDKCPYCEKDRINAYSRRYNKKENKENNSVNETKEPSLDELEKLMNHFNKK